VHQLTTKKLTSRVDRYENSETHTKGAPSEAEARLIIGSRGY
jgi:hypothetical protein